MIKPEELQALKTFTWIDVLRDIRGSKRTTGEIRKRTGISSATISSALDAALEAGLVQHEIVRGRFYYTTTSRFAEVYTELIKEIKGK